jgi:hypothetical protein
MVLHTQIVTFMNTIDLYRLGCGALRDVESMMGSSRRGFKEEGRVPWP